MSLVLAQPQLDAIAAACRRHQVLRMERRGRPAKAAQVDQTGGRRTADGVGVMSSQEIRSRPVPLSDSQLAAIALACRQHRVARLHAFGSVLRPDYRPGESDIDLLVEFLPLQPIELADAYFGLEHQLTEKLDSPVDLVMADAVRNPIVRADIEASKRLIYEA